jgi:clan AA aspartic protease (TIGR02281 family)
MPRSALLVVMTAGLLVLPPAISAEIYQWTDGQGRLHYTQNLSDVPAPQREAALGAASAPSRLQTYATPRPAGSTQRRSGSRSVMHIPFEKHGNAMLVHVRVNDRVTAPFLVDTGASDVAIPTWVADQAGILVGPDTPRATYQTANGLVTKPVVSLDSLEVGHARVEDVRASISDSMDVGLLGGTFFNNFTFQVDPAAHVITVVRNDRVRSGLSEQQWRQRFRAARGRLTELERYLADNDFARESRVAELESHRTELVQALEELEDEANRSQVPQAWRE